MAAVRYSQSQKSTLEEFIYFAKNGDKILNSVLYDLTAKYRKGNAEIIRIRPILTSNEFISNFEVPCNFKLMPTGAQNGSTKNLGRRGDMVEAYVWFLYINYGISCVERYIIKNLKLILAKLK